eukprot:1520619-Ditylum_brightwellii.AAC.1
MLPWTVWRNYGGGGMGLDAHGARQSLATAPSSIGISPVLTMEKISEAVEELMRSHGRTVV